MSHIKPQFIILPWAIFWSFYSASYSLQHCLPISPIYLSLPQSQFLFEVLGSSLCSSLCRCYSWLYFPEWEVWLAKVGLCSHRMGSCLAQHRNKQLSLLVATHRRCMHLGCLGPTWWWDQKRSQTSCCFKRSLATWRTNTAVLNKLPDMFGLPKGIGPRGIFSISLVHLI